MKCPIDNIDLVMTDRQGVEIDYCPQCRGVWLDRGELDKIIERSQLPGTFGHQDGDRAQDRNHGDHGRGKGHGDRGDSRRRGGIFDIFDF
jgi:hypothetical protein